MSYDCCQTGTRSQDIAVRNLCSGRAVICELASKVANVQNMEVTNLSAQNITSNVANVQNMEVTNLSVQNIINGAVFFEVELDQTDGFVIGPVQVPNTKKFVFKGPSSLLVGLTHDDISGTTTVEFGVESTGTCNKLYVLPPPPDNTGSDANDGLTWATSKATIVNAITTATDGTTIYVGPGTYIAGQEILISKAVKLVGYGDKNNVILTRDDADPRYRILHLNHACCVVENFTISNGIANDLGPIPVPDEGGNVRIQANATLQDCVVFGGTAFQYGGNVYIGDGHCYRCIIYGNKPFLHTTHAGGGLYIRNSGTVDSCLLQCNTAGTGGGITISQFSTDDTTVVSNCTMRNNTATGFLGVTGGGFSGNTKGYMRNCIAWENSPNDAAYVLYSASQAEKYRYNNVGSEQVFAGSGPGAGPGLISSDPLFQITPIVCGSAPISSDSNLQIGSPSIGTGNLALHNLDVNKNIWCSITSPDMGALAFLCSNSFLSSFTVATLPSPSVAGAMIYVSDETGGAVPAFSDGSDWRRVTDRMIVS